MAAPFSLVAVPSFDWNLTYVHQRCQFTFYNDLTFVISVDFCDNPDTVIVGYCRRSAAPASDVEDDSVCQYYTLEGCGSAAEYTLRDLLSVMCVYTRPEDYRPASFICYDEQDINFYNYLDTPISRLPVAQFDLDRDPIPDTEEAHAAILQTALQWQAARSAPMRAN